MDKAAIKEHLLELLPDADVRIDQSDIVRIFWQRRMAFVNQPPDDLIQVSVYLLPENPDPDLSPIEPDPRIVDQAYNDREAATKVAKWLTRVVSAHL